MHRAAAALLFTLTASAVAQTAFVPATPGSSTMTGTIVSTGPRTTFIMPTPLSSCPVGLSAQPGVGPGMVIVVDGNATASQKLNLQFTNTGDPRQHSNITGAQITVHGLTARGRIAPARFGDADDPDAATLAKQVDLALTVAPGASASTGLLFKGFTSIRWITLDSLTYADGSTWHPSPQHSCRVVPNRVMLVATH
jgi:hypothetical protein